MPGIADVQPMQLQTGTTPGALDSQPDVNVSSLGKLPEFDDFMGAYRSGFITADDIRKRQGIGNTDVEAQRALNNQRTAEANQGTLNANDIQPLQREAAKGQLTGTIQQQTLANDLMNPDPAVYGPAQEKFTQKFWDTAAIQRFGTAKPTLEVAAPAKPEDFHDWVNRQVTNHPFPPGEAGDRQRAAYQQNLEALGEKGDEYQTAVSDAKNRTRFLAPGDPEYHAELRKQTEVGMSHEKLQQIQFDTLRAFGEAKGKAAGEEAGGKGAREDALKVNTAEGQIREEIMKSEPIKELTKADSQYQQILLDEAKVNTKTDEQWRADPSAAKALDLHLAFNYFKILHPDTRVTESNFKEIGHLSPIEAGSQEIADQLNLVMRNTSLDPTGRRRIIEESKRAYSGYVNAARPVIEGYRNDAIRKGMNPDAVTFPWKHVFNPAPDLGPAANGIARAPSTVPAPTPEQVTNAQVFKTPAEVPDNVQFFKTPDGRPKVNINYKP